MTDPCAARTPIQAVRDRQLAFLDEVVRGARRLETFDDGDIERAAEVLYRYRDLALGIADASIVVRAERHGVHDVPTLDEGHFRAIRAHDGRPFRLLPADATTT